MNILGPDYFIFAVDDPESCADLLEDYGLIKVERSAAGIQYVAQDGTGLIVRKPSDTSLPGATAPDPNIREVCYGVADKATLEAIGAELSKDREVKVLPGGILRSTDNNGYPVSFQVSIRRPINPPHHAINVPGLPNGRPINETAANNSDRPKACSLSHVVMFTQDKKATEEFYTKRLGFRVTDVFTDLGPFMRPAGTTDHHTNFFIEAPLRGVQHFTFHFATSYEQLKAGWHFVNKGHKSFWGPGRHLLGSNNFWYFHSPFGGLIEMDADMDRHDDSWTPRHVLAVEDTSQVYLLQYAEMWMPRGPV
jgi:catechol 2,3-dioxygenase-like lactoylglutathione lyase family enzyme